MGALNDAYLLLKGGTLWSSTGRCKGYAVSNPAEAAKIDGYVASLDAGQIVAPPQLATLTGRGLVGMLAALTAQPPIPTPVTPPSTVSNSMTAGMTLSGTYAWKVVTAGDCAAVEYWATSAAGNNKIATITGATPYTYQFDTTKITDGTYQFGIVEVDTTGVRHPDEDRRSATIHNTVTPVPTPTPSGLLALDYESGSIVKPAGKWDALEISGSGAGNGAQVTSSQFPGWTHQGAYTLTPGSQTQGGWHDRALSRMDRTSFTINPGTHVFYAFSVRFPSSMNSDGFGAGRMVTEFIHNDNGVVNSMIAPLGIFIHTPQETWDGSKFNPITNNSPALVLRVCGGYVPNQQPGGSHPATNQADWHPNIMLSPTIPTDTNQHFIVEVLYHQGAGATTIGGGNVHSSPMFNGADPAVGTVRVWMATTNQRPVATDFHKMIDLPTIRTLVYGDDGNGNVVNDKPYGPFAGLYDSADTIGYTAQSVYPFYGAYGDYTTALTALTG